MQILAKADIKFIRIGERVKMMTTLDEGIITDIHRKDYIVPRTSDMIFIRWESGKNTYSDIFYYDLTWLM